MLTFLDVHFKALTSITLSDNKIVTTSLDSLVHVLDLTGVLNGESTPLHTLDKHALGVTDSGVGFKTVYSVGRDCMLWSWEIETGRKSGFVYPRMLTKICVDVLERVFFYLILICKVAWVGDVGGNIYQTTLGPGDGSGSIARDGVKESLLLSHHTGEITGLTQSLDGSRLVSSSLDGTILNNRINYIGSVVLWDTRSGQAVNVLFNQETPVLFSLAFPTPNQMGEENGGESAFNMPIVAFKKFPGQEPGSCMILPREIDTSVGGDQSVSKVREGAADKSLQDQVADLERERERLVAANDVLYQAAVRSMK